MSLPSDMGGLPLSRYLQSAESCKQTSYTAKKLICLQPKCFYQFLVPRSGLLSFENRKISQKTKTVEYGGLAMTLVSCLAKKSVIMKLESDGVLKS